jgi:hypothetical protein
MHDFQFPTHCLPRFFGGSGNFTNVDADLYFALLHKCNRIGWKNPFPFSNRQIGALLNVSEKTLIASRNRLKQAGLIDFTSGKSASAVTLYSLGYCKNSSSSGSSLVNPSGGSLVNPSGENTPDFIKQKTKTKTTTPLSPSGEKKQKRKSENQSEKIDLPHSGERFRDLWLDLISMPKWEKKPETSLNLALKKLGKFEENFACELISTAIEGNYQGVVFPDTNERYLRWKNAKNGQFDRQNVLTQPTEWKEF